MIDTGCSVTLVNAAAVEGYACNNGTLKLMTLGNDYVSTEGYVEFDSIIVDGFELGSFVAHKVAVLPLSVDLVLGLDLLLRYEFTMNKQEGEVKIMFKQKSLQCANLSVDPKESETASIDLSILKVEESDFSALFDGSHWTVKWVWKDSLPPQNTSRPNYRVNAEDEEMFDNEIKDWIEEGILTPWKEEYGEIKNIIPLMSVKQHKGEVVKVRPVLDFRFLNDFVRSNPGSATPLCRDRLRQWRQNGTKCAVVDLKRAYLQIRIDRSLWCYQAIRWRGKTFLLTRLGFGLNIAPKAMTKIVETSLAQDEVIAKNTSSYIDDIFVVENEHSADVVVSHLQKYGLKCKPIERLGMEDGVRVLGVRVDNNFRWKRDGKLPEIPEKKITRRETHSILGEWLGHFPVAGWLRVACAFIQRSTAKDGVQWDEYVSEATQTKVVEVQDQLKTLGDPCKGKWIVNKNGKVVVWTDASSLALGIAFEIDDNVVEDAAWLRKENDSSHINLSELDAAIKGVNLAVNWGVKKFTLKTDSATVYGWLKSVFQKTHNVRTHALGEILIRRRLELLDELMSQEGLDITVELVKSTENKADALTRVPKKWIIKERNTSMGAMATMKSHYDSISEIHKQNHFGVQRTLELAREKFGEGITTAEVEKVVRDCEPCARICPAAKNNVKKGWLFSSMVWHSLSSDLSYFGKKTYLTLIDNGSRFCIWREVKNKSAEEICGKLSCIFAEMGPPKEFITDNESIFHSIEMKKLMEDWNISHVFSCAYRPQGNGLIERNHKTIKIMAARSGNSVETCVFWYNTTKGTKQSSPYELLFHAKPKIPGIRNMRERSCVIMEGDNKDSDFSVAEGNPFVPGDKVFLRSSEKCTDPWSGPHRITAIKSSVSAEINEDGITRHISHLRKMPKHCSANRESDTDSDSSDDEGSTIPQVIQNSRDDSHSNVTDVRRSDRYKKSPHYLNDYCTK